MTIQLLETKLTINTHQWTRCYSEVQNNRAGRFWMLIYTYQIDPLPVCQVYLYDHHNVCRPDIGHLQNGANNVTHHWNTHFPIAVEAKTFVIYTTHVTLQLPNVSLPGFSQFIVFCWQQGFFPRLNMYWCRSWWCISLRYHNSTHHNRNTLYLLNVDYNVAIYLEHLMNPIIDE